jgi:histidyl-tRNA synthetase
LRHRAKLIAYFEQHVSLMDDDAKRRLNTNPLRILDSKNPAMQDLIAGAPKLMEELDAEALEHFAAVKATLTAHGVPFEINPRLVRGLDYYNRTVFEWVTTRLGAQGTICAGGRYDGLVEQIGGKPAAAMGFAMGVERLLTLLQDDGMALPKPAVDVYVVHQGELASGLASRVSEQMRDVGLRVVMHCGGGSFKSQMKKADGSAAKVAVVIGDDEAQVGQVSVKPMQGGEQVRVSVDALNATVQALLN